MTHDRNEHCLCDTCYSDDCKVIEEDKINVLDVLEAYITNDIKSTKFLFTNYDDNGNLVINYEEFKNIIEEFKTNLQSVVERGRKEEWLK